MRVRLLYFDDCPSWRLVAGHLDSLRLEFDLEIEHVLVDTPEASVRLGFHGSPSIVVADEDLFPTDGVDIGLSCRIYQTPEGPAGCPTLEQTRAALARARRDW